MSVLKCALAGAKACKTPDSGLVCDHHRDRLLDQLREIPDAYALLGYVAEPGSIPAEPGEQKRRRTDESPAPVRLEVLALRDLRNHAATQGGDIPSVLGEISSWARVVREDRGLVQSSAEVTVTGEISLLVRHLDWVCEQLWVDEFANVVSSVRRALLSAIGEPPPRPIGKCPVILTEIVDAGGFEVEQTRRCGGPLWPDRWGVMRVECGACGETWDEEFIRRMTRIIDNGA